MIPIDHSEEHARVNLWLRALGARTGLALQLGPDGVCAVGHSSGLDCAIEVPDGQNTLFLRIPLMAWPSGEHPHLLAERCLQENFIGVGAGAACFAIDRAEAELLLWLARPLDTLDETALGLLIVEFFATAVHWKQELEEACRQADLHVPEPEQSIERFA